MDTGAGRRSAGADDAPTVQSLAQEFHDVGFVTLEALDLMPTQALVERVRAAVLRKYDAHLARARAQAIDLALLKNAEVLAGFYVREGGRVDMQISALEFQPPRLAADREDATAPSAAVDPSDTAVDPAPFYEMARSWQRLMDAIFSANDDASSGRADDATEPPAAATQSTSARYRLEYIGCVVSRPGDADQNWHLDGVHRNVLAHERADRLNVFVPLVDVSDAVGGTEMKRASHVRASENGAAFESYAHLPSVTPCVRAGTPIVMDYRVWHRGRANASEVLRPLLYFKYVQQREAPAHGPSGKRSSASASETSSVPPKKRKRIALTQVPPPTATSSTSTS